MESTKIYFLIRNICECNYSPSELVEFIDISQKIAINYLRYQEVTGKNIRPKKAEELNNLEDIAVDCIAGLFMRNDDGEFIQLKRYFGPTISSSERIDDEILIMMLRRLVVKKTKQELSRIFKERDPEGAKILRNIHVAIRNSDQFRMFKEMGREFVYLQKTKEVGQKSQKKLRRNSNEIPEKELHQQFLEQYSPTDSVSVMMKKMLNIVDQNVKYQNFLAINVIANIIREITLLQFKIQLSHNIISNSPFNDFQTKEVNEVNRSIIEHIHSKIQNQYLKKNKIDKQKADIYFKAISDFVQDLTLAKESESNFRYLKRYIPDLTQTMYREQERSIFEYLVKVTKKSLRKKLKELL